MRGVKITQNPRPDWLVGEDAFVWFGCPFDETGSKLPEFTDDSDAKFGGIIHGGPKQQRGNRIEIVGQRRKA